MRTTQYVRQEKAIAAADKGGIRERWMWGLRLLRDPEAFNPGSSQLRPHVADEQIAAAQAGGFKLNATEIRLRLRCAQRRAYLEQLIAAADNDLSVTWKDAHDRLGDGAEPGAIEDPPLDPEDM